MKNLVLAVLGLIIVIVLAFFFTTRQKSGKDTLIPGIQTVSTPSPDLLIKREATKTAAKEGTGSSMKKTYQQPPPVLAKELIKGKKVRIKTAKGEIVFELFETAPIASSNFIFLANDKFYDGLIFHRREEKFVVQGGDPNGNGTGGPGYNFPDEPVTLNYERGIVAMANSGPNTNGSQFFIMLEDTPGLPKKYTIFGKVTAGMEVVDQIKVGDAMLEVAIE